jgi:hypothetical protein
MTTTDVNDISGYVAYILTHSPASKLENRILRLQGETTTLSAVVDLYVAAGKGEVVRVDKIDDPFSDFLQRFIEAGKGSTGYDPVSGRNLEGDDAAGSGNALWEGHRWLSAKESLGL